MSKMVVPDNLRSICSSLLEDNTLDLTHNETLKDIFIEYFYNNKSYEQVAECCYYSARQIERIIRPLLFRVFLFALRRISYYEKHLRR